MSTPLFIGLILYDRVVLIGLMLPSTVADDNYVILFTQHRNGLGSETGGEIKKKRGPKVCIYLH